MALRKNNGSNEFGGQKRRKEDDYAETWTQKTSAIHKKKISTGYNKYKMKSQNDKKGTEDFIWGIVLGALYQMTRAEKKDKQYKTANKGLTRLFLEYFLPKK